MKKNILSMSLMGCALIAIALFVQACSESKGKTPPRVSDPIPVKVISLEKSAGTSVIQTSGQLTTNDETNLGFKIGGVVNAVLVKEGDQVRKGQLLAILDLTEINAQVAQARHAHEKAARDFARVKNLYRDSVATLEQLQNAETGLAIANEQLQAASFNRSFAEIHAPASGYVLKKFVNPGQVVGIGDPILLTNGAVQGKWILKVGVSDKQWAAIRLNDKATVRLDAFPARTFQAFVSRKAETSDPQTGAFAVELQVNHGGEKLASGMFASATLQSGEATTSWNIPFEALLDANDDEGFVFVTNDSHTARKVAVVIGSFDGKNVHVVKGLEDAQALIVAGSAYLTDNSAIHIVK